MPDKKKKKPGVPLTEDDLQHIAGGLEHFDMLRPSAPPEQIKPEMGPSERLGRPPQSAIGPLTPPPVISDRVEVLPKASVVNVVSSKPAVDLFHGLDGQSASQATSHILGDRPLIASSEHLPEENRYLSGHVMSPEARNVAQGLVHQDPQEVAEIVKKRANALLQDTAKWWDATGNRSYAQKILKDVVTKLDKSEGPSEQEVWHQLERLDRLERYNNKIPISDTLTYQQMTRQAKALGIDSPQLQKLDAHTEQFGLDKVSTTSTDSAAKQAHTAYQEALQSFKQGLVTKTLKELGGKSDNPLGEVMKKNPQAAWSIMQYHGEALRKQLEANGVLGQDSRFNNPAASSPSEYGIDQILAEPFPTANVEQILQNRLAAIENIERQSGYALLSDTSIAAAKGEIPITQIEKPSGSETWGAWAARHAYSAVTYLPGLLKSSVASRASSAALRQAQGYVDAADKKVDKLTENSLASKVEKAKLAKSSARSRQVNDQWSLDNFKIALKRDGHEALITKIDDALKDNLGPEGTPLKPPRDIVQRVMKEHIQSNRLTPEAEAAYKKYQSEVTGARASIAPLLSPWVTRGAFDGVRDAAAQGKLDHMMSLDGISKSLESFNDFAKEVREGVKARDGRMPTKEEMEKEYEQNINQATDKIADTILPPSWNPATMLKRFLLKMTLRDYYLKGIGEKLTDPKKVDGFLAPAVEYLKTIKDVDWNGGTDLDKAHRKLAFSKMVNGIVDQLGQKATTMSPEHTRHASDRVAQQAQTLSDNVNLERALNFDPNSWGATALRWGEGIGKSLVFYGPEKQQAKDTLLQNLKDIAPYTRHDFDMNALSSLVERNQIGEAQTVAQREIDRLRQANPRDDKIQYWDKILQNLKAYGELATGLGDVISKGHQKIVADKLVPWLHGRSGPTPTPQRSTVG